MHWCSHNRGRLSLTNGYSLAILHWSVTSLCESEAKERAKVKVHFEGDGPVGLTDINPIRAHLHVYKAIMKYEVSMTI